MKKFFFRILITIIFKIIKYFNKNIILIHDDNNNIFYFDLFIFNYSHFKRHLVGFRFSNNTFTWFSNGFSSGTR